MPDKPIWYTRLEAAIAQLERLPSLGSTAPLSNLHSASAAVSPTDPATARPPNHRQKRTGEARGSHRDLRALAAGEAVSFEVQRRERLHSILDQLHHEQKLHPRVLVEAPTAIVTQEFKALPPGVHLSPGRIVLDSFSTPEEAKQKLLALVMAMANDPAGFMPGLRSRRPGKVAWLGMRCSCRPGSSRRVPESRNSRQAPGCQMETRRLAEARSPDSRKAMLAHSNATPGGRTDEAH